MLVCAFLCASCTRDRGCSAHPVFPAPSLFKRVRNLGASSRETCGENVELCLRLPYAVITRERGRSASSRRTPGPITTAIGGCAKAVEQRLSTQPARRMGPGVRRDDGGGKVRRTTAAVADLSLI